MISTKASASAVPVENCYCVPAVGWIYGVGGNYYLDKQLVCNSEVEGTF
ncbi:MAG TPA: hypothetical protein VFN30_07490 [Chitinophagaceae bacterium]|nr:hypothetical protein [Chitinophagaceae bacterium]